MWFDRRSGLASHPHPFPNLSKDMDALSGRPPEGLDQILHDDEELSPVWGWLKPMRPAAAVPLSSPHWLCAQLGRAGGSCLGMMGAGVGVAVSPSWRRRLCSSFPKMHLWCSLRRWLATRQAV